MKVFDIYSAIGNISRDILEESENCKKSRKEEFSAIINEKIHSSKTETVKKDIGNEKIHFRKYTGAASIAAVAACMAVMIIGIRVLVTMTNSGVIDDGELISIKTETALTSEFAPFALIGANDDTDYSIYFKNNYNGDLYFLEYDEGIYADQAEDIYGDQRQVHYNFGEEYVRRLLPFDTSEFSDVSAYLYRYVNDSDKLKELNININDLPADPENEEYPHSKYINITINNAVTKFVPDNNTFPIKRFGVDIYGFTDTRSDNSKYLYLYFIKDGIFYRITFGNMSYDEAGEIMDAIIKSGLSPESADISIAEISESYQKNISLADIPDYEELDIFSRHIPQYETFPESGASCNSEHGVSFQIRKLNDEISYRSLNITYSCDNSNSVTLNYQYPSEVSDTAKDQEPTVISPIGLFAKEDLAKAVGITDNEPITLSYYIDFNDFDIFVYVNNCNIDMLWEIMKSILPTDERMSSAQNENVPAESETEVNEDTADETAPSETEQVETAAKAENAAKKNFYNDNEPIEISIDEYENITRIDHTALYNINPEMTYDDVIDLLGETVDPTGGAYEARYIYTRFIYGDESLSAEYYDEYIIDMFFPTKDSTIGQSANQLLSKAVPIITPYDKQRKDDTK